MDPETPLFEKLQDAVEYLYFWSWLPEASDVAMFWRTASGSCRRYCIASGGGAVPIVDPPQVIHDDEIDSSLFEELMNFALDHGILDAPLYYGGITTSYHVDTYAVKTADNRKNLFRVAGGVMRDERTNEISEIFLGPDGLGSFYEERRRLLEQLEDDEPDVQSQERGGATP